MDSFLKDVLYARLWRQRIIARGIVFQFRIRIQIAPGWILEAKIQSKLLKAYL
jgi:hypothetical protein